MAKYIIEGGKRLKGEVRISGNKNAVFPCMAASLLTNEDVILENIPQISDVDVMVKILKSLGAEVEYKDHQLKINTQNIKDSVLPTDLTTRLRGSIVLAGALLGRFGKATFTHPGGDVIGKRGIDLHLEGFKRLGYKIISGDREYKVEKNSSEKDITIFLELPTVTGTENLVLATALRDGVTVIRNAAQEPHIVDLANMLNKMGGNITGIGTPTLTITGVQSLSGVRQRIGPDNIEFGTYSIAAAITNGEITLTNCLDLDRAPVIWPMEKMGLEFKVEGESIKVSSKELKAIPKLITNVWPGFPTDLMSVMIVLATQAKGVSLFHDWLYESRMFFVDKLISMGANITIADPHRVLVYGPNSLMARDLETPDIRAGMALVLAGLVGTGTSTINRAELIERGYENVVENLARLGANIKREA